MCTFRVKINFPHAINVGAGYYINFNVTSNFVGCNNTLCGNNISNPTDRESCSFSYNSFTMGDMLQITSMSHLSTGPIINASWEVRLSGCPLTASENSERVEKRDVINWFDNVIKQPKNVDLCQNASVSVPLIEVWDPTPRVQTITVTNDYVFMDGYIFVVCGSVDPTDYLDLMTVAAQAEDPNTALSQWGCTFNDTSDNLCPPFISNPAWSNPLPSPFNVVRQSFIVPNALFWTVRGQGQKGIPNKYFLDLRQNPVMSERR